MSEERVIPFGRKHHYRRISPQIARRRLKPILLTKSTRIFNQITYAQKIQVATYDLAHSLIANQGPPVFRKHHKALLFLESDWKLILDKRMMLKKFNKLDWIPNKD